MNLVQAGMGEKLGFLVYALSVFLSSMITAFIFNWEMTLITVATLPVFFILAILMTNLINKFTRRRSKAYARAGNLAEEVLASIR